MVRKRIIVRGNVQGVGYRVLVKQVAGSLGISGLVRNMKNRSVEIYGEGSETVLKRFIKAIRIRRKDGNVLAINVTSIDVYNEKSKEYQKGKAPKDFTEFEIDYGRKLSFAEKESIEQQERIILGGSHMWDRLDSGFGVLHDDLCDVRKDLMTLDEKYGEISRSIHSIDKNFEKLVELVEKQTNK